MARKKQHHDEHVDETWLIPYADMLTLLLALFIVMFAMGQIDKEKFQKFSEQFQIIFSGGSGIMDANGNSMLPKLQQPDPVSEKESLNEKRSDAEIEDDKIKEIKEFLDNEFRKAGYAEKVSLLITEEGLEISIQDAVLFRSGDAQVLDNAAPVLQLVARILLDMDNNIRIVGHTDNIPIKNSKFRSNWDLSAVRAINVMHYLVDTGNMQQSRFYIQGNGEYSPKYDNSTEAGRAGNRRVEIVVIRKYPMDQTGVK